MEKVRLLKKLIDAVMEGDYDEVYRLVELIKVDLNQIYEYEGSPLHVAVKEGDIELVKYFLDNGADPNIKGAFGETPLHIAVDRGYLDIVKLLLEKEADPNVQSNEGNTPLHLSVIASSADIAYELISHGANKEIKNKFGKTPLDLAMELNDEKMIKILS
ncbi:ankyrin repeat domain-containing protein [Persephonella sp. IF05-L8]|uniref:ankyrin repeat domain-containing protein n=1 Tax=Persephonella sp. IF05-L8 TaxID=1158338 RepID=UPI00049528AC